MAGLVIPLIGSAVFDTHVAGGLTGCCHATPSCGAWHHPCRDPCRLFLDRTLCCRWVDWGFGGLVEESVDEEGKRRGGGGVYIHQPVASVRRRRQPQERGQTRADHGVIGVLSCRRE